jgi:hypothetical protein
VPAGPRVVFCGVMCGVSVDLNVVHVGLGHHAPLQPARQGCKVGIQYWVILSAWNVVTWLHERFSEHLQWQSCLL